MAGQIPQHFIDELLTRVDIVDVINQRVTLKKSGSNYSACCPFHNEKTPSFTVSQTKQFYHCFGCSANGNAISFLMEYESMHFVDAIETLAESINLEVPRDRQAAQVHDERKPLYALMESIAAYYYQQLKKSDEAIAYLKSRGLTGITARHYSIGYVPDGWDGLQQQFPNQESALLKTGMLVKSNNGKRPYQRFRNRIVFPIRDRRGRVIGFGGRVLDNQEPKYLNSPETVLFHKGSELYGLYEARKAAQDAASILVVEGYMDVVVLAQHGISNVVATLGTATNQQHSETLYKIVPTIVFCFDGDRAGRDAAWRALQATLPCLTDGRDAHFLFLPDNEDPDSIVRKHGESGFNELFSGRKSIIDFLYEYLASDIDTNTYGGKSMLTQKITPLIETIPRGTLKFLALERLEQLTGQSFTSHASLNAPTSSLHTLKRRESKLATPMERAMLLCLQHPGVVHKIEPDDIDIDPSLRGAELLVRIVGYCDADEHMTTARLLERFRDSDKYESLVRFASKPYWPDNRELDFETACTDFVDCIRQLRRKSQQTMVAKVAPKSRTGLLGIAKR
ncbi:MAG: DNA primase [Granulosicoccus sp.]|nr:DNA primase [Granulosicoccus sp.]